MPDDMRRSRPIIRLPKSFILTFNFITLTYMTYILILLQRQCRRSDYALISDDELARYSHSMLSWRRPRAKRRRQFQPFTCTTML